MLFNAFLLIATEALQGSALDERTLFICALLLVVVVCSNASICRRPVAVSSSGRREGSTRVDLPVAGVGQQTRVYRCVRSLCMYARDDVTQLVYDAVTQPGPAAAGGKK